MDRSLRQSYRAALVLFGGLLLVKLALTVIAASGPGFRSPAQAAVFDWPFLVALFVLGAAFVWLNHWVGLPGLWDVTIPFARRFTQPVLIGLAMGLVSILVDYTTGWSKASAARMGVPSIHIPWPQSALIYPGGAVIVNTLYYLIPIPLLLAGAKLVRKYQGPPPAGIFWPIGVLAALVEPITQSTAMPASATIRSTFIGQAFAENMLQVWSYRRAGWVSSVVLRIAFYLVWHVLWGLRPV